MLSWARARLHARTYHPVVFDPGRRFFRENLSCCVVQYTSRKILLPSLGKEFIIPNALCLENDRENESWSIILPSQWLRMPWTLKRAAPRWSERESPDDPLCKQCNLEGAVRVADSSFNGRMGPLQRESSGLLQQSYGTHQGYDQMGAGREQPEMACVQWVSSRPVPAPRVLPSDYRTVGSSNGWLHLWPAPQPVCTRMDQAVAARGPWEQPQVIFRAGTF